MTETDKDNDSISLCLSGGGLRATFFHLGTVFALKEAGLLQRVRNIYSVSGGSITAAHIALKWNAYNGTWEEAREAAADLLRAGAMDIRGRVFRRQLLRMQLFLAVPFGNYLSSKLGLLYIPASTEILINEYTKLFGNIELNKIRSENSPKFHFLATSLITGKLAVFTDEGLTIGGEPFGGEEVPVALAVAASSAFPPLCPPNTLEGKAFAATREKSAAGQELLSDGGVFDNLGCFLPLSEDEDEHIVLSDASADIDNIYDKKFSTFSSRLVRSTDIVMQRLSAESLGKLQLRKKFTYVKIEALAEAQNLSTQSSMYLAKETHMATAAIRTDLDIFNHSEIKSLVINGYVKCKQSLGHRMSLDFINNLDFLGNKVVKFRDLNLSGARKLLYFNKKDPVSWILWAIFIYQFIAFSALVTILGIFVYTKLK